MNIQQQIKQPEPSDGDIETTGSAKSKEAIPPQSAVASDIKLNSLLNKLNEAN